MQQDKHIINKLQQLENQQLPDLSQMDSHWQQMQAMLVPAAAATKSKRWLWLIPAAALIVVTALLLNRYRSNNQPVAAKAITKAPAPIVYSDTFVPGTWTIHGDTIKLIQHPPTDLASNKRRTQKGKINTDDLLPPSKTDTQYFNINFIPCVDSNVTESKASNLRQQWLNELFAQLKKEPNQFIIDNRKDTTLFCQEGTALQIPAGSLGGTANVLFTVKEIYKKSDMVLNQLSATSNKALLESGGMLQLTATVNDQPVEVAPNKPITVYMADTSNMQQMQLFTGEKTTERLPSAVVRFNERMEDVSGGAVSTYMNWIPQYRYFTRSQTVQDVKILYLSDEAAKVTTTQRGLKVTFLRSVGSNFPKKELKQMLQDRYGDTYYKIRVRNQHRKKMLSSNGNGEYFAVGDSIWVDKQKADKNKWPYSVTRNTVTTDFIPQAIGIDTVASVKMDKALQTLNNRYGININRLGWINCDRFGNYEGEKADYVVQLGDEAANYHTLLVFNKLNSLMNGYISGNTSVFTNVPVGMEVTVVSVGINKKGQPVYAMQKAVTDKTGLSGISFQPTEAAALPNALSKLDR